MAGSDLLELGLVERTPSEIAGKPQRTPMTDEDVFMIKALSNATLWPASWDKRFVRSIAKNVDEDPDRGITDRQREMVRFLAHRYRRQVGFFR